MSSNPKKAKLCEDKDVNCRLRHGLNVHCLAIIFQYLDNSVDLYTVGGMNDIYKQIINDFVIPKHTIDFYELYKKGIIISQVFERYGTKIKRFSFTNTFSLTEYPENTTTRCLLQSINQFCTADQFKMVKIIYKCNLSEHVVLPIQFQKVEKFEFSGCSDTYFLSELLTVQFSESLRYLRLEFITLDTNFDWSKLKNLNQLYLKSVRGINKRNFIDFLHHRPNLEVFHHDKHTFEDSTQDILNAMAEYCGDRIQEYSDVISRERRVQNPYNFISKLKNVKKVRLNTYEICFGDIIDALKRLAKNDTIQMLHIKCIYNPLYEIFYPNLYTNCTFKDNSDIDGSDMRHFSHLKTIIISGNCFDSEQTCAPLKLLREYGPQILSNVENLTIEKTRVWDFIKFAPKLRTLSLSMELEEYSGINNLWIMDSNQAIEILSILESIHRERNDGQDKNDDFIEIKFKSENVFELFNEINGRSDAIKLSMS